MHDDILIVGNHPLDPDAFMTGPMRVARGLAQGYVRAGRTVRVVSCPYSAVFRRGTSRRDGDVLVRQTNLVGLLVEVMRNRDAITHVTTFSLVYAVAVIVRWMLRRVGRAGPIWYTVNGVATVESGLGYRSNRLVPIAERVMLRLPDRVIAVSSQVAQLAREVVNPKLEAEVVGNGVDERFVEDAGVERTSQPTVLFPGGLHRVKGVEFFVAALEALESRFSAPWKAIVVGAHQPGFVEPPGFAELIGRGRLEYLGSVDHARLMDLYRSSWVVVLPSSYESFGQVALEAMAMGTPVVVSDRVGMAEQIQPPAGVVVPFGDEVLLADILMSMLQSPDRCVAAGRAARQWAAARTWSNVAEAYLQWDTSQAR